MACRQEETKTIIITPLPKLAVEPVPMIVVPRSAIRPYIPSDPSLAEVDRMAREFIGGTRTISHSRDIRQNLEERVVKRIGKKGKYIVEKLFELIEGVHMIDNINATGEAIKYYQRPPNLNAIIYALDRVLGKPKQTVDKSEEKRGIFVVEHIIKHLAEGGGDKPIVKTNSSMIVSNNETMREVQKEEGIGVF